MKYLFDVSAKTARDHFLKGSSYFNGDFPRLSKFRADPE